MQKQSRDFESTAENYCEWVFQMNIVDALSVEEQVYLMSSLSQNFFFLRCRDARETEMFFSAGNVSSSFHRSWLEADTWRALLRQARLMRGTSFLVELAALAFVRAEDVACSEYFSLMANAAESDENLQLIRRFLCIPQVRGDRLFPGQRTLFEKAAQYRKYLICSQLLDLGEGAQIHENILNDYFLEGHASSGPLSQAASHAAQKVEEEVLQKLQQTHQNLIRKFEWNRFWQKVLAPFSEERVRGSSLPRSAVPVYTEEYGCRLIEGPVLEALFRVEGDSISAKEICREEGAEWRVIEDRCAPGQELAACSHKQFFYFFQGQIKYPGFDFVRNLFSEVFTSYARPLQLLGNINGKEYLVTQIDQSCQTLEACLRRCNSQSSQLQALLDKNYLSERILVDLLLYPERTGAKGELLQLCPNSDLYHLVNISDSRCFGDGVAKRDGHTEICVKNIVFCMDFMLQPIPPGILEKYAALDPSSLLTAWAHALESEQSKSDSRSQKVAPYFGAFKNFSDNAARSQTFLLFPWKKQMFKSLVSRLNKMVKVLRHAQQAKQQITHLELFGMMDSKLAPYYAQVHQLSHLNVLEKFQVLESNLELKGRVRAFSLSGLVALNDNFQMDKSEEEPATDQVIEQLQNIGPSQGLDTLRKYQHLVPCESDLARVQEQLANRVNSNKKLKFFLTQIIFEYLSPAQQSQLLGILADFQKNYQKQYQEQISSLILNGLAILDMKTLRTFNLDRITVLCLRRTNKITDSDLPKLHEWLPCLAYLDLSENSQITQFCQSPGIKNISSTPLHLPCLKTLVMNDNTSLTILDVMGSHIQNISCDHCPALKIAYSDCPQLQRLSVVGCKQLLEELLSIFVIEGVDTVIDEQTSAGFFASLFSDQVLCTSDWKILYYEELVQKTFGAIVNKLKTSDKMLYLSQAFSKRKLSNFQLNEMVNLAGNVLTNKWFSMTSGNHQKETHALKALVQCYAKLLLKNKRVKSLNFAHIDCTDPPVLITVLEGLTQSLAALTQPSELKSVDASALPQYLGSEHYKVISEFIAKLNSKFGVSFTLSSKFSNKLGSGLMDIMAGFKQSQVIVLLDVSKLSLDKDRMAGIRDVLASSSRLQQLILKNCQIQNEALLLLGEGIKQSQQLRVLDISDNQFDKVGLQGFAASIEKCITLRRLVLDGNCLLGLSFTKLRYVREFSLQQCELSEPEFEDLSAALCDANSMITYLDLSFLPEINARKVQLLIKGLAANLSLRELKLCKTLADNAPALTQVIEALRPKKNVQSLNLSLNQITEELLEQVTASLLQPNSALKELYINDDSSLDQKLVAKFLPKWQSMQPATSLDVVKQQSLQAPYRGTAGYDAPQDTRPYSQSMSERLSKDASMLKPMNANPEFDKIDSLSRYSATNKEEYCRIGLSIDGGGMRGLVPATLVNYLCRKTNREVCEMFDVVGGTSIGGILALGCTATSDGVHPVVDHKEIMQLFQKYGSTIFNANKIVALFNNIIDRSKYDNQVSSGPAQPPPHSIQASKGARLPRLKRGCAPTLQPRQPLI